MRISKYIILPLAVFLFQTNFIHANGIHHEKNEIISQTKESLKKIFLPSNIAPVSQRFYKEYTYENNMSYELLSHPMVHTTLLLPKNFYIKNINYSENLDFKCKLGYLCSIKITKGSVAMITFLGRRDHTISLIIRNISEEKNLLPHTVVKIKNKDSK